MLLSFERRQRSWHAATSSDLRRRSHVGSVLSKGYPPRFVPPMTTVRGRGSPAEFFEIPYLVIPLARDLPLQVIRTFCRRASARRLLQVDRPMLRNPCAHMSQDPSQVEENCRRA